MRNTDPYSVLGVNRSASEAEIKTAYRRLALRFHPDVSPEGHASESRFREIAEAYEILGDAGRRREWDSQQRPEYNFRDLRAERPWPSQVFDRYDAPLRFRGYRASRGWGDFEEFVFDFFRAEGSGVGRRPQRGRDLHYNLTLDFSQAFRGVFATLRIMDATIEVRIPPGVDTGTRIRVPGAGGPGFDGGPRGDLYLIIAMMPDPFLSREGDDIHLDVSITAAEAALGARISIPGPVEPLVLNLPRGTRSGTMFRFAGRGFPSLGTRRRGDFYVRTRVVPY